MRVLSLFIIVTLSASLTACAGGAATSGDGNGGGGGTDGGASDSDVTEDSTGLPDPCALVTKAEVESAVGGPMTAEGEETDPAPNHYAFGLGRQCVFGPVSGVVSPTFVTVYTYSADGWEQYKTNQASFSSYREITGVGEEAVSPGSGGIGVRQGDIVLDIQVGYEIAQDPAGEGRLITLATTALGRL